MDTKSDARARLRGNRALIIERSLAAGLVGLVPLPSVDDLLSDAVRRTLLQRIAAVRNVGLDDDAADTLARPVRSEAFDAVARVTSALALLRRRLRRVAYILRVTDRAEDVAGTFALATLFDHYCATHHVGPDVDRRLAVRLRAAIEGAISDARRGLARKGARRSIDAVSDSLRRAIATPRALLGPRRHDRPEDPPAHTDERPAQPELVAPEAEAALARPRGAKSAVGRGALAIANAASALGESWLDELLAAFDARWAASAPEHT